MVGLKPASEVELAEALADCAASRRSIRLGGHFTKDALAGVVQADATVSTCAMRRVLQYEPRDLTISVEAGLPWSEFAALLASNRQMVPLDPPWFDASTVGGVVAANMSGPRRRLYGSARDLVIGMRFATLDGKVVQSGGMVVKNVAGLDMSKLMIGSWGTLAAIAVVNFKLVPMPHETRSFVMRFETLGNAVDARDAMLRSPLQPASMDLLNPAGAGVVGLPPAFTLLLQAGGSHTVLDRYSRELPEASVIGCEIWEKIREFVAVTSARRISTTLAGIADVLATAEGPALARAGSGIVYIAGGPKPERAPASEMMRRVKDLFDPNRLLNPGRSHDNL